MKTLMVMRHAEAEWSAEVGGDRARALSGPGCEQAREVGRLMASRGVLPDLISCSSACRTRETLDHMMPSLVSVGGREPHVVFDDTLYCADEKTLLMCARAREPERQTQLIIAHNPGVHGFVAGLVSEAAEGVTADALMRGYPPGALSVFTFDVDAWEDVAPHTGLLTFCEVPPQG